MKKREDELAFTLTVENGKTIKDSRVEVNRAIDVLTVCAEESIRRSGTFDRIDISARSHGINSITSKFPVGLVSLIVPFNFPINLAVHKIGPAIAAGCPWIMKPSEKCPLTSSIMGDILNSIPKLPADSWSILPTNLVDAHLFSTLDGIKAVSFTGSAKVGWHIKSTAGKKKVMLELGSNAACIVDDEVKDLDKIADRIVFGSFFQAGQSCISVQRVMVHEKHYDALKEKLIEKSKLLVKGDPLDENTFVSPLISEQEAKRVELWIKEATDGGAKLLLGGKRSVTVIEPTIVENVPVKCNLNVGEVFGPVFTLTKFKNFKEAIQMSNDSVYGLQTGIFTDNINKAFYAFENLEVGGVVIGDIPSTRIDTQPYGGIKDSGVGREGIKYAMDDFSEIKVMLLKDVGLNV